MCEKKSIICRAHFCSCSRAAPSWGRPPVGACWTARGGPEINVFFFKKKECQKRFPGCFWGYSSVPRLACLAVMGGSSTVSSAVTVSELPSKTWKKGVLGKTVFGYTVLFAHMSKGKNCFLTCVEKGPPKREERVSPHKCFASSNKQTMRRECVEVRGGECKFAGEKPKLRHVRSLRDSKTNLVCLEREAAAVHLMVCKCSCDSQKYCLK